MNANIRAMQFAEQELRDHDRREAELRAELKEHRKARADKAARVQECIDVLCGRATPNLFAAIPTPAATEMAPVGDPSEWRDLAPAQTTPVVCSPVGAGRLKDIPGLSMHDLACLSAVGLTTLADLERECDGDLSKLAESLENWAGAFTPGEAARIQQAVERHLKPATVPHEPQGVRYPTDDGWRKQGLALLKLNEKLLKACKKEEVATLGELHDWIDEETRDAGGFFGPGVLARELTRIGKLAAKWGQANAEIIYQFCADYGFAGVPEKEVA